VSIRFYVDPITGLPHIHDHLVTEEEVMEVLENAEEDRPGRAGSRVAVGQTSSGRYLRVIYAPDPEPKGVFVITAFEPTAKQLLALRRRRRRH
jgi:Domain of unknown function (DUF4258)